MASVHYFLDRAGESAVQRSAKVPASERGGERKGEKRTFYDWEGRRYSIAVFWSLLSVSTTTHSVPRQVATRHEPNTYTDTEKQTLLK